MSNVKSLRIKNDDRPLYTQAVDALRVLINDRYQVGDKLPSEPELGEQLGISRTTLRVAISYLEQQGLLTRRHGVGTFVSPPSPAAVSGGLQFLQTIQALAKDSNITAVSTDINFSSEPASKEHAGILAVEPGSTLNRTNYKILIKDLPVARIDTYSCPEVLNIDDLKNSGKTFLEYLLDFGSQDISYTHSKIFAVEADDFIASELKVEPNKALLHLVETYYTKESQPIALSYNYFVTERFNFYIGRIFKK